MKSAIRRGYRLCRMGLPIGVRPGADRRAAAQALAGAVRQSARFLRRLFPRAPGYYRLRPVDGSEVPFLPAPGPRSSGTRRARRHNAPLVNTSTLCLPSGTPRIMTAPYPMKVIVQPKEVTMLFEVQHLMRFVYLNEKHPKDLDPTFMGHSVGHWEGDTLVVDTVGLKDFTTLDQCDLPKSGDMHVIERISKIERRQAARGPDHHRRSQVLHQALDRQGSVRLAPGHPLHRIHLRREQP